MCEIPNRTSCLWPSPGCLPPPPQPCAGSCPPWADGCSPSSPSPPSKVRVPFLSSIWRQRYFIFSLSSCSGPSGWSADGPEGSWQARWQRTKPRCPLSRLSSEDSFKDLRVDSSVTGNGLSRQQVPVKSSSLLPINCKTGWEWCLMTLCRCAGVGTCPCGPRTWRATTETSPSWQTTWTAGPTTAPRWRGGPSRGSAGWGGPWTAPAPFQTQTTRLASRPRATETSACPCRTWPKSEPRVPRGPATGLRGSTGGSRASRTRAAAAPRRPQGRQTTGWKRLRCFFAAKSPRSWGTGRSRIPLPRAVLPWRRRRAHPHTTASTALITTWPKACCASMKNLRMRWGS